MSANVKNIGSAVSKVALQESKPPINIRDEQGRFKKGFSGNPNAWATRKLNTPLALLCREKVEDWMGVLDSIIKNEQADPNIRVTAIKLGFEYGYGKPLQGNDIYDHERRDYEHYIKNLAREIHESFDFTKTDVIQSEQEIKAFIAEKTENDCFLNRVFDDVLKHVGGYVFGEYMGRLNRSENHYKYID